PMCSPTSSARTGGEHRRAPTSAYIGQHRADRRAAVAELALGARGPARARRGPPRALEVVARVVALALAAPRPPEVVAALRLARRARRGARARAGRAPPRALEVVARVVALALAAPRPPEVVAALRLEQRRWLLRAERAPHRLELADRLVHAAELEQRDAAGVAE